MTHPRPPYQNPYRRLGMKTKTAIVYKDKSGYWVAEDDKGHKMIGNFCDSELEAYKLANRNGYIVR